MLGWDAYLASSGAETVRLVEAGLDVSVLLIDFSLPDADGRAIARVAQRLAPSLGIVFMSHAPVKVFGPRREPLLHKPFSTAALADALSAALALRDLPPDGGTE